MKQNKEQNNMKVVGITGGVGSGKSVVMNILKEKSGTTRPFKCDYTSECKKRDFPSD